MSGYYCCDYCGSRFDSSLTTECEFHDHVFCYNCWNMVEPRNQCKDRKCQARRKDLAKEHAPTTNPLVGFKEFPCLRWRSLDDLTTVESKVMLNLDRICAFSPMIQGGKIVTEVISSNLAQPIYVQMTYDEFKKTLGLA
jgi:hypothetical protein